MKFYKYCANGNDFVIFADESGEKKDRSELAKQLCDRHRGIGADGLIVILPKIQGENAEIHAKTSNLLDKNAKIHAKSANLSRKNAENLANKNAEIYAKSVNLSHENAKFKEKKINDKFSNLQGENAEIYDKNANLSHGNAEKFDFEWDFYNCDGSVAFMCGNGSRAAAHFAATYLNMPTRLKFKTLAGIIAAKVDKNEVEVRLTPVKDEREVDFAGLSWQGCDSGVPHLVHFCEDLSAFDATLCKKVRDKFNANVSFAKIVNESLIKVRTFERGVEAETWACGTAMAACFYLALKNKQIENKIQIEPKSKERVFLREEDGDVYFKGFVRCCFEANYHF